MLWWKYVYPLPAPAHLKYEREKKTFQFPSCGLLEIVYMYGGFLDSHHVTSRRLSFFNIEEGKSMGNP